MNSLARKQVPDGLLNLPGTRYLELVRLSNIKVTTPSASLISTR
jgi:hypothetical protein